LDEAQERGAAAEPSGELVDIDLESRVATIADLERSINRSTNEVEHS